MLEGAAALAADVNAGALIRINSGAYYRPIQEILIIVQITSEQLGSSLKLAQAKREITIRSGGTIFFFIIGPNSHKASEGQRQVGRNGEPMPVRMKGRCR